LLDSAAISGDTNVVTYPGGKSGSGVYQRIISLMPKHKVYIEPFLGGGSVMRLKLSAELNIGVDMDGLVIEEWRSAAAIRNGDPGSAEHEMGASPRFWWHSGDGIAFLEGYPFTGEELVYCDPPYVRSTCTTRCRYRFDLSDVDHRRLLRRIRTIPCPVILSGYWSQLYADELVGWHSLTFKGMTRRGPRTEWLWYNFPAPSELHDPRYLGANRREREYLKKQMLRWTKRIQAMPPLKRQVLASAIARVAESEGVS
jgi:hypothetical protein